MNYYSQKQQQNKTCQLAAIHVKKNCSEVQIIISFLLPDNFVRCFSVSQDKHEVSAIIYYESLTVQC
jgi:hypothetical protein